MKWGFGELDVFVGAVWELATQAIVSPINCEMLPSAGLGAETVRRAGPALERELTALPSLSIGEVAVTGPGALRCQRVIHAALQSLSVNVNEDAIRDALRSTFKTCREHQFKSVAIPTIEICPRSLPPRIAADLFVEHVMDWLKKSRIPERVVLVVPSDAMADIFKESAKSRKLRLN